MNLGYQEILKKNHADRSLDEIDFLVKFFAKFQFAKINGLKEKNLREMVAGMRY